MQSVSSRIWTRIVVSNSYDDNHYTTGTVFLFIILKNQAIRIKIFVSKNRIWVYQESIIQDLNSYRRR